MLNESTPCPTEVGLSSEDRETPATTNTNTMDGNIGQARLQTPKQVACKLSMAGRTV